MGIMMIMMMILDNNDCDDYGDNDNDIDKKTIRSTPKSQTYDAPSLRSVSLTRRENLLCAFLNVANKKTSRAINKDENIAFVLRRR